MGLLGSLVKSSIEGVVIELDKGNTPYVVGEQVTSHTRCYISTVYFYYRLFMTNIHVHSLCKSHQKYLFYAIIVHLPMT